MKKGGDCEKKRRAGYIYIRDINDKSAPLPRKEVIKLFRTIDLYTRPLKTLKRIIRAVFRKQTAKPYTPKTESKIINLITQIRANYPITKPLMEKVAGANLRLVISTAKKFLGRGVPLEELIGVGNLALMLAIEEFDYKTGNAFTTYLVGTINGQIKSYICNKSQIVRIPDHLFWQGVRTSVASADFENVPEKFSNYPLSEITDIDLRQKLFEIMDKFLDPRRRLVIQRRFFDINSRGKRLTLEEVGDELGVTKEMARNLQNEALKKLNVYCEQYYPSLKDSF